MNNKTLAHFWEKVNFTPNDAQRNAILSIDGPLFITAGPGSGKTRVLLWRTLNLIVYHDVPPEEIFLSTFTEKAAKQLQDGLQNLLGMVTNETGRPYDIARMSIGTVHSLCQKLLVDRRFNPDHSRRRAPILLDELDQYFRIYKRSYWKDLILAGGFDDEEAAQRAINQWVIGRDVYSRHEAVRSTITVFNRFSEENLDPARVSTDDPVLASLIAMYRKYKTELVTPEGVALVDFSLLQQRAWEYFMATDAAPKVFSHVIVDEYQDTNAIQEKLFFRLASGSKNICVVGDDDQALYRFRGATVENLVQFESRCEAQLGERPARIDLSVNYRSRSGIVDFCGDFIRRIDWEDPVRRGLYHRIHDKVISAHRSDPEPAVITSTLQKAGDVYEEVALYVKKLRADGIVSDYNQIAFLFPAMKSMNEMNTRVHGFIEAFKKHEIPWYAPRAGRFLEVEEALAVFGLFQRVFGAPKLRDRNEASAGFRAFQDWLGVCKQRAGEIAGSDALLDAFLNDRASEVAQAAADYELLLAFAEKQLYPLSHPVSPSLVQELSRVGGLSLRTQKALQSHAVNQIVKKRHGEGNPVNLKYLLNRVTALDWTVLDLFYQVNGFDYFRPAYENAESGVDEGPICNLGLITQYLARFMDEYATVLTGQILAGGTFVNLFYSSYLYALFRLGESEFEDAEDPFPKGRIPFLTIHQSKGLEFPVVVLGAVYRTEREAPAIEVAVRQLLGKSGEPLERQGKYDSMRLFYVGLSRAKNLLILPRYTHGKAASPEFKAIFEEGRLAAIPQFDNASIPKSREEANDLGGRYSYTGDYLMYRRCPRNYMIYRQYGFVPSRGQTMFFGRLIHETVEDLHNLVISKRAE